MTVPLPIRKATPEQLEKIGAIAAGMVRNGDRVGLGSGKAALAFVRALGARICDQRLKATGVPTSLLTEQVAREVGIPLATLEEVDSLDITVDGADEVDPYLNLTKGGGGNLTREKVVASITKKFVIVVGEEKIAPRLGTYFPVFVEVIDFALPVVTRKLRSMGAEVTIRTNPDGSPFLTDNGNPYLHCLFTSGKAGNHQLHDPYALDLALHHIPGVVETGLFINMANEVIVAHADGTVEHKS
ncbi:MAG TPA: ribose-5-phosphate isomerase RpiA [Phycisphaerae bacterium]|nr:ribose-5-phosphate isomerase RpiA [Phycisphaerae bacterium]